MSEKLKQFYKKILCGAAIGVGFILPGISGGVLAVSMGLFEPMIDALKGLLHRFKQSFLFLLPIGIGGVIGVLLTSLILKVIIAKHEPETLCLFCGFMLGSLPTLWHESLTDTHTGFRIKDVLWILGGFIFMMLFWSLDTSKTAAVAESAGRALPVPLALAAGAVAAVGIIVPGLSSSFLLEYLGVYKSIVDAIASVYLPTLFFCALGFVVPAVLMVLLISRLFKRFRAPSYLTIMGISVGSMALIVPSIAKGFTFLCIPLLVLGFAIGLWQALREIRRSDTKADFDLSSMVESMRKQ